MAITKLMRIKEAPRGNKAARLKANLVYICNDEKTGGGIWVGGNAGGTPEVAYRTMIENKKRWGKEDGSQAFHYILSFSPDANIDETLAYKIAEEFCQELLGDDYYYIFAVHNDKKHMHVHIIFDSVSKTGGYKFHSPYGDWEQRIQPITDRLCEKYHLPTLDYNPGDERGRNYGDWKKKDMPEEEKEMYYSWNDIVRDDIDEAIQHSDSYDGFLAYLKSEGYEITRSQSILSIKPKGRERAIRTGRLGDGYSKDEIIQRISDKQLEPGIEARYKTYGNREEMRESIYAKIFRVQGWKMSPMQRQFWRRWNNTYFIRKPGFMSPEEKARHKEDILEIRQLTDSLNYMIDHDIETPEDLGERRAELQSEQEALNRKIGTCQTRLSRKLPLSDVSAYLKLQKEERASPPDDERETREEKLIEKIEAVCPIGEAVLLYQDTKKEISDLRGLLKDNKKEMSIVDDTFRLFYQMTPERIPTAEKVEIETEPITTSSKTEKETPAMSQPGVAVMDAMMLDSTKVTINEKLFADVKKGDMCVTRIPYQKVYVMIPDSECFLSDDGSILTAWIKDEQEYQILSPDMKSQGCMQGKELKKNYEDKTDRRKENMGNVRECKDETR